MDIIRRQFKLASEAAPFFLLGSFIAKEEDGSICFGVFKEGGDYAFSRMTLIDFLAAVRTITEGIDPRDPDYSRPGIFALHNCWKCNDGKRPCVNGNPAQCDYPRARND